MAYLNYEYDSADLYEMLQFRDKFGNVALLPTLGAEQTVQALLCADGTGSYHQVYTTITWMISSGKYSCRRFQVGI